MHTDIVNPSKNLREQSRDVMVNLILYWRACWRMNLDPVYVYISFWAITTKTYIVSAQFRIWITVVCYFNMNWSWHEIDVHKLFEILFSLYYHQCFCVCVFVIFFSFLTSLVFLPYSFVVCFVYIWATVTAANSSRVDHCFAWT